MLAALVVVCTVLISAVPASAASPAAGQVRFVKNGGAFFDRYTRSPSPATKSFFLRNYAGMVVHAPYFNRRLRYFPRGWVYTDLYGIPRGSSLARKKPSWILRGKGGRKLYVPFECQNGKSCVQYAGDPTNPAFRRYWIRRAKKLLAPGYVNLYIDNVNLIRRVSTTSYREVTPRSPRSGRKISAAAWRRAIARFTRQIRRALPKAKITHNAIWFAPGAKGKYGRMQIRSANVVSLERGVNDAGLTGGTGQFALRTFLRYIDWVHKLGPDVLLYEDAPSLAQRNYGLAGYFLINNGRDYLGSEGQSSPANFWRGYRVRLGAPLRGRYLWRGLLRRDFTNGVVLLNVPQSPIRTVDLPASYARADYSERVRSVTLGPGNGAVLVDPR